MKKDDMPSWFWLGGISYDMNGIIFYGYIPVPPNVLEAPKDHWKWVCWPISEDYKDIFAEERSAKDLDLQTFTQKRLQLFRALLYMRQHTIEVAQKLSEEEFGLPEAYEQLGKAWEEKDK